MAMTALPDAPNRATDTPAQFSTKADALVAALPDFVTEANALEANVVAKEAAATTAAATATTKASEASDSALSATSAPGTSGTSTTSLTLAVGSLSFTTQTGKTWSVGMNAVLARTSDPSIRALGYITSYNSGTGAVQFYCEQTEGATLGPFTDWTFSHAGAAGTDADLVMPSWAPSADASVTYARNGHMCRPSATLTLTPEAAATLGDGFSMLIAPTAGTTTVSGVGTVLAGTTALLYGNGSALALIGFSGHPLLASLTPTAAANVDFLSTFSSTYDNYLILIDGVKPATDDSLYLRFGVAGAADTGANYGGSTGIPLNGGLAILAAGKGISATVHVLNANDTTNGKVAKSAGVSQRDAVPTYDNFAAGVMYIAANAISGFRLYWSGGANFSATGKVRVYGYNN